MKSTILNILLGFGFISVPYFAANQFIKDANITKIIPHIQSVEDSVALASKIDSIDRLNKELNDKTYKTLKCDNQILCLEKKDILQLRLSNSTNRHNSVDKVDNSIICDTLKNNQ